MEIFLISRSAQPQQFPSNKPIERPVTYGWGCLCWVAVAEILRRNIDIGEELMIRVVNGTSQDLLSVESALCFVRLRSARFPKIQKSFP